MIRRAITGKNEKEGRIAEREHTRYSKKRRERLGVMQDWFQVLVHTLQVGLNTSQSEF